MRRLLLLLLALAACSKREEAKTAPPAVAEAPAASAPETATQPIASRAPATTTVAPETRAPAPAPAGTLTPSDRIAHRMYEQLLNGRRAATTEVEWSYVERDGQKLVEDITKSKSRSQRNMAGYLETFDSESIARTLRTEDGELVSAETVTEQPGRVDKTWVQRTPSGYKGRILAGASEETFEVATEKPLMVDAEAFLAKRIQAGTVKPGDTFEMPLLLGRRVGTSTLKVVGPDKEGPGLKVVETVEGNDSLWWFAEDGSVVRVRSANSVIRRDDAVAYGDLPTRPATYRITLPANASLPRIFTTKRMIVDVLVRTDETTKPPNIPESAFTEVKERAADRVTLILKSHDDPKATCPLPIDPKGFEDYLKATALMEVNDPDVRRQAKEIVGDAKDAREAARRIADWVFTNLEKGSAPLPQPTAKQILAHRCGDCSEHALLFTALCRAAGIPVRQCSGYVCIGSDWGAHSWCEIWVGRWIGADPTTDEIGTRARYILLARPDEPVEASRIIAERTSIVIRSAEYDDGTVEIGGDIDPEVYSGIRLGPVPDGWRVTRSLQGVVLKADGFAAYVNLRPDQGYRSISMLLSQIPGGSEVEFGKRTGVRAGGFSVWIVPLGRELLQVRVQGSEPGEDQLAKVLAPTLDREE
jgi:transglutaminase-like putative cysteine protease